MFNNKSYKIAERIVSVSQPHVLPIIRGKARSGFLLVVHLMVYNE